MKTRFNFPTRILFGQGVIEDVAEHLLILETSRPLVVTDRGLMATDIPERLVNILRVNGLEPSTFYKVDPNPTDEQVEAGTAAFREHEADAIVALGGGSPLDAAKAIQIRINHGEPLEEYDDLKGGDSKILGDLPPLAAIPTTAGTGSEVSRSAVITVAAADRKVVLFSPRLMPAVAVCDPELTYGLPARITAETGMDALSHNIEAYLAAGYHPMADGIALRAIRMIAQNLPTAFEKPKDEKARQEMLMASTMGAVAFQKGLGVIHSLAHPLSTVTGMSHGLANSIMMPVALRFNGIEIPERVAMVAHALGTKDTSVEGAANTVTALAESVGLPTALSEAGVKEEQIEVLSEKAMQDGCHTCNARECTLEDMSDLFKEAI
ncbi:MAG: iron-containing alcohol dehydrogenase [Deltaproteobacteria bacterium]|nr:iron-containing alcohol dehydrogenase [Deltaproteobacteria bacterium]